MTSAVFLHSCRPIPTAGLIILVIITAAYGNPHGRRAGILPIIGTGGRHGDMVLRSPGAGVPLGLGGRHGRGAGVRRGAGAGAVGIVPLPDMWLIIIVPAVIVRRAPTWVGLPTLVRVVIIPLLIVAMAVVRVTEWLGAEITIRAIALRALLLIAIREIITAIPRQDVIPVHIPCLLTIARR